MKNKLLVWCSIILSFYIFCNHSVAESVKIDCSLLPDGSVVIQFPDSFSETVREAYLYRSTSDIDVIGVDSKYYPITKIHLTGEISDKGYRDAMVAANVRYFYQLEATLESGVKTISSRVSIQLPDTLLGIPANPEFHIDKTFYTLSVMDNGHLCKRYPIALGRNPVDRKLHQDNATTPEGLYKILNLQPHATFYKAYDINYPNDCDRGRYELAKHLHKLPKINDHYRSIGGEIQIHGMGIESNWTFGCIALRNADMDELFACKTITTGIPVVITGNTITNDMLECMEKLKDRETVIRIQTRLKSLNYYTDIVDGKCGKKTFIAIGKFQSNKNLVVTCYPDAQTMKLLFQ
ncbi:L,D-transpeptidase family protein [bacterium]|nr:L,D-transpeptidase family protein [candidate division CSSED10-310 bacterium]